MINTYTKLFAAIFLFLVVVAALGLAVYELATGQSINPAVYAVLSAGIGAALSILGIHQGVSLANQQAEANAPPVSK